MRWIEKTNIAAMVFIVFVKNAEMQKLQRRKNKEGALL